MSLGGEGHIGKKVVVVWPRNKGLYAPLSLMVQVASTAYCRLAIPIKWKNFKSLPYIARPPCLKFDSIPRTVNHSTKTHSLGAAPLNSHQHDRETRVDVNWDMEFFQNFHMNQRSQSSELGAEFGLKENTCIGFSLKLEKPLEIALVLRSFTKSWSTPPSALPSRFLTWLPWACLLTLSQGSSWSASESHRHACLKAELLVCCLAAVWLVSPICELSKNNLCLSPDFFPWCLLESRTLRMLL